MPLPQWKWHQSFKCFHNALIRRNFHHQCVRETCKPKVDSGIIGLGEGSKPTRLKNKIEKLERTGQQTYNPKAFNYPCFSLYNFISNLKQQKHCIHKKKINCRNHNKLKSGCLAVLQDSSSDPLSGSFKVSRSPYCLLRSPIASSCHGRSTDVLYGILRGKCVMQNGNR